MQDEIWLEINTNKRLQHNEDCIYRIFMCTCNAING